jgi:hypothetical protein
LPVNPKVKDYTGNLQFSDKSPGGRKIKIAVENTYELCHEYHPSSSLEVHLISRRCYKEMNHDP